MSAGASREPLPDEGVAVEGELRVRVEDGKLLLEGNASDGGRVELINDGGFILVADPRGRVEVRPQPKREETQ
jgi:hypothetical protein